MRGSTCGACAPAQGLCACGLVPLCWPCSPTPSPCGVAIECMVFSACMALCGGIVDGSRSNCCLMQGFCHDSLMSAVKQSLGCCRAAKGWSGRVASVGAVCCCCCVVSGSIADLFLDSAEWGHISVRCPVAVQLCLQACNRCAVGNLPARCNACCERHQGGVLFLGGTGRVHMCPAQCHAPFAL